MGLRLLCILMGTAATVGSAWAFDVVGSQACATCHPAAFRIWKAGKHARSFEVLSTAQSASSRCLTCHSPNASEAGVTCESCHGGGQFYLKRPVMKDRELARLVGLIDPSEKTCRSCHDGATPSLKAFDFQASMAAIDHWTKDRLLRAPSSTP